MLSAPVWHLYDVILYSEQCLNEGNIVVLSEKIVIVIKYGSRSLSPVLHI